MFFALTFLFSNVLNAMTIQTCVTDYRGSMNVVYNNNGNFTGIAKLFASTTHNEAPFTLVSKDGKELERHGTITTTLDLNDFVASGTCSFDNRFMPIHSIDDDKPWRQFQMKFDSYYDSTIMASYNHNGIQADLMIANGWTWGSELPGIHVFEINNGEFSPIKYDINTGNGELPAYKAGNRTMSLEGDGGMWQYRASSASDDGRIIVGYARLEQDVNFDKGSRISRDEKFAMVWQITDSCSINRGKCNNKTASRLTSGSSKTGSIKVQAISRSQFARKSSENASNSGLKKFDMLNYNPDETMAYVYDVTTVSTGKYLLNGRSASGKAMVSLITL
jgi:hypothetical protein